jgi:hypothetical protein
MTARLHAWPQTKPEAHHAFIACSPPLFSPLRMQPTVQRERAAHNAQRVIRVHGAPAQCIDAIGASRPTNPVQRVNCCVALRAMYRCHLHWSGSQRALTSATDSRLFAELRRNTDSSLTHTSQHASVLPAPWRMVSVYAVVQGVEATVVHCAHGALCNVSMPRA